MLRRLSTSLIFAAIMITFLFFWQTPLMMVMVAGVSSIVLSEILSAGGHHKKKQYFIPSIAFAIACPFCNTLQTFLIAAMIYLVAMLIPLVHNMFGAEFQTVTFIISITVFVSTALSTMIYFRTYGEQRYVFYLLVAAGCAWWSDSWALFIGTAFGKHKLCPNISPRKTVEGFIGGYAGAVLCNMMMGAIYAGISGGALQINYLNIAVISIVVTPIGVLGDLIASVYKRQLGIKDYGYIMPGHGGLYDRFDSAMLTIPAAFLLLKMLPAVR